MNGYYVDGVLSLNRLDFKNMSTVARERVVKKNSVNALLESTERVLVRGFPEC